MFLFHFTYAVSNSTTLESMSAYVGENKHLRSKYDWGLFFNLGNLGFFNQLFWFPNMHNDKFEGYFSPCLDENDQYIEIRKDKGQVAMVDGKFEEIHDVDKMKILAEKSFGGFTFIFSGETFK